MCSSSPSTFDSEEESASVGPVPNAGPIKEGQPTGHQALWHLLAQPNAHEAPDEAAGEAPDEAAGEAPDEAAGEAPDQAADCRSTKGPQKESHKGTQKANRQHA